MILLLCCLMFGSLVSIKRERRGRRCVMMVANYERRGGGERSGVKMRKDHLTQ